MKTVYQSIGDAIRATALTVKFIALNVLLEKNV